LCTGTNISFKGLFDLMALCNASKITTLFCWETIEWSIAWRMSWLLSIFSGKQTITKDSAQSAQTKVVYDSSKLKNRLNFHFRSIRRNSSSHAVEGRLK
jgi:hypothetical protein